jgi:2,4-dienoyl-CoA reductase-like NADH-dependent reductase (Old Yellow Enzyme family)
LPSLFSPLTLHGHTLRNRIMMAPMCQWSAADDGIARDWHFVHYGARAVGGAGLLMTEAIAVESRGRISQRDLGIWDDGQIAGLARIVDFCHAHGASVGVQLAHAGRKAWSETLGSGPTTPVGPSAVPFDVDWQAPHPLSASEIDGIVEAFGRAARRAAKAGVDVIELHGAHGYLISEFLSPLANQRDDEYGGDHAGRARFGLRVVDAVRDEWPDRPLLIRISCTDWADGGNIPADAVEFARMFKARGVDLVDCSSGGVVKAGPGPIGMEPGYQVAFAEQVRREAGVPTAAVGRITQPEQAAAILDAEQADLIVLGRALLADPHWPLHAAKALAVDVPWPPEYKAAAR